MKPSNLEAINSSFELQAKNFENSSMNFSKKEYLDYTVSCIDPQSENTVLEVAAGTCACGRSLAPFVRTVICLDATPAMLEAGKEEAQKHQLENMVFVKGYAEDLPFLDNSFDIVISRLAFHHFPDVHAPFKEMARVLKSGGKLVLIDMEAAEEQLRATEDEIETLRDPSHVKNLSKDEILKLFTTNSLIVEKCESTKIPVSLSAWMELTKTPGSIQEEITRRMEAELNFYEKTGFSPYHGKDGIFFSQRWILTIGKKPLKASAEKQ